MPVSLIARAKRVEGETVAMHSFESVCATVRAVYDRVRAEPNAGELPTYIPQLASVDPSLFAVAVTTIDGRSFSVGDVDARFCIQSCSKPLTYLLSCERLGRVAVHTHVSQEPSGGAHNHFSLDADRKPYNPLVNTGAISYAPSR